MNETPIITDPNTFSLMIEIAAVEKKISCMDSVLKYCADNFIEPDEIAHLINRSLREKIEVEMRELNYLPKKASLDL